MTGTQSPTDPDIDDAVRRILSRERPTVALRPPLWHDPARFTVVVAAVGLLVTANLPWLHQEGIGQTVVVTGRSGVADGVLLAVLALATARVVLSDGIARSRDWLFRWLPAILGLTGLLFVLSAVRSMANQLVIWKHYGATGVYEPWFYVFLGTGLVFAFAAIWVGLERGLARTTGGLPNERLVVHPAGLARAVVTTVGLILGVMGGMALALNLGVEGAAVSLPLVAGSILGGGLGGMTGARLGRLLIHG